MDMNRIVFIYLPGQAEAVPAGKLDMSTNRAGDFDHASFRYGAKYLERHAALDVDPVSAKRGELGEVLTPVNGLGMFGAIRDAAPDSWGRRVIENRLRREGPLEEWLYLDHAGSERAGALDVRPEPNSPAAATALPGTIELRYLLDAADRIEAGEDVPAKLMHYFEGGPTMGGMRPKAVISMDGRQYVAKFPSKKDRFNVPAVERATLELARQAGLNVPATELVSMPDGRSVMLIERFDREPLDNGLQARRHMVTALTMLGLYEMESPDARYADIADVISQRGPACRVAEDRTELFGRMVFNILVHNDDDHLRNHSFLYDAQGGGWTLSPLYDVVPAPVAAMERDLHLSIGPMGRAARLDNAFQGAGQFKLLDKHALMIIDRIHRVVREWRTTFEALGMSKKECDQVASAFSHAKHLGIENLPT